MQWRLPTQRDVRLGSGLVLLTYIGLHLFNHALGLVSLSAAERALTWFVWLWHSLPGTALLYGAAAMHVTLALLALYRRRTLRMPPLEILRIALGLGIPILLIGHVVSTRIAWEGYRVPPEYTRVVWSLWLSDGEGRQLALMVPGWLHGCLGVNFAFGRRPLYRRLRPVLFAVALLLPVLGGLGFLAMGKELSADVANRTFLDENAEVALATRLALAQLREGLLFAWFALIAAVFAAREVRAWIEQRRATVIDIAYPQRIARVPRGWTVLEASRSHHIAHVSMCGGQGRCSTCRVEVVRGEDHCPPPADDERATLARIHAPPGLRLACQLRPTGDVAVVPLLAPEVAAGTRAGERRVVEREIAVVRVTWADRTAFASAHLPHDVVYLGQRFATTVDAIATGLGGMSCTLDRGAVTAIFMSRHGREANARVALRALSEIEGALVALAAHQQDAFHVTPRFTLCAHVGHGAVALEGGAVCDVAGDVFATIDTLAARPPDDGKRVTLSPAFARVTGTDDALSSPG